MEISVGRHPRNLVAQLRKLHAPREGRRLTPTTTRRKTSLASEEVADRNPRRTRVGSLPPRQSIPLHQEVAGEYCAEQPSIPDAAGTEEIERQKLPRIFAVFGLGEEHQDLRADQPGQQHPQTKIVNFLMRQTIALRELNCDQDRAEKCDSEKDAIRVDWETANMKNLRIHLS